MNLAAILLFLLAPPVDAVRIVTVDKQLIGTDKMLFVSPPDGVTWKILNAAAATDKFAPGVTFHAWIQNPPFEPFRDPITGELNGACNCRDLLVMPADTNYFFPIVGYFQSQSITITGPTRLGIALTPEHGALPEPIHVWVGLKVVEGQ